MSPFLPPRCHPWRVHPTPLRWHPRLQPARPTPRQADAFSSWGGTLKSWPDRFPVRCTSRPPDSRRPGRYAPPDWMPPSNCSPQIAKTLPVDSVSTNTLRTHPGGLTFLFPRASDSESARVLAPSFSPIRFCPSLPAV
eukprot:4048117-Pyramimonas_sp.AAC.1